MEVAIIQSNLVWENPVQNRINFSKKIERITKPVDLIVLPEMFTSGFTMNPVAVAETMQGDTVRWMQSIAELKQCAIMGSVVIKEEGSYVNRLLFVEPSMTISIYDKKHTFTLAGEHNVYKSGNNRLIVNYRGWRIMPLVCYDLRFPVWARNVNDYDLLIYVANWPKPRINAWDVLLKARAIENMSYCIGVNRVGIDAENYEYPGHSAVYDVLGNRISNTEANEEHIEIVSLSKNHIEKYRDKLKFLSDRDLFSLK